MSETFSETLRRESQPAWSDSVRHRFVRELCDGSISDRAMARYLIQDHRFLDSFLMLLGAAMATADTLAARLRLGRSAGFVSGEENTYFLRAFAALELGEAERDGVPDAAPTAGFKRLMQEAAASGSYAAALAVLCVAEWLYLDWASQAAQPLPPNFVHREWITLHDNPDFRVFVAFLRGELDRVGPQHPDIAKDFFSRAVMLEKEFLDAAYA
ncbi:MAG: TenA family protein [Janthinobacterium lividum]